MRVILIIFFLYIQSVCVMGQYTFNLTSLCTEANDLEEIDNLEKFSYFLERVVPALQNYCNNGKINQYLDLIECSQIEKYIYDKSVSSDNDVNLLKHESIFNYEIIKLRFTRNNYPEQWSDLFIKRITNDQSILDVAKRLSKISDGTLGKASNINTLKEEIIFARENEFKYASKHCVNFTAKQIKIYNEYIADLASVKPFLLTCSCI